MDHLQIIVGKVLRHNTLVSNGQCGGGGGGRGGGGGGGNASYRGTMKRLIHRSSRNKRDGIRCTSPKGIVSTLTYTQLVDPQLTQVSNQEQYSFSLQTQDRIATVRRSCSITSVDNVVCWIQHQLGLLDHKLNS